MSKQICFIRTGGIKMTDAIFHDLHEYFSREIERLFFVNVSQVFTSRLFHYKSISKAEAKDILPENFTYITPKNLAEFKNFLKSHDLVVICYFSETWRDWYIHHYLRKYSIPMVYLDIISAIGGFRYKNLQSEAFLTRFLSMLKFFRSCLLRGLALRCFLHNVDTIFISRRDKAEYIKNFKKGRYGKSEVVITNSTFYDNMLRNNFRLSNDYVVFLDSMLPYHGDALRFGHSLIDREAYYKNLNRVFDVIESALGKEVVICLHPRYEEENATRDFGKRRTFKYRTDEFTAKAELVLFHQSSAVNSAIVYGKKIVQLTGSQFNDFTKNNCQSYQKFIPITTLEIYECDEDSIKQVLATLEPGQQKYDEFLSNFIVASGQKGVSPYEQIADKISRKYGILRREEK